MCDALFQKARRFLQVTSGEHKCCRERKAKCSRFHRFCPMVDTTPFPSRISCLSPTTVILTALRSRIVIFFFGTVQRSRQLVFSVGMGKLSTKEEELSGIVDPNDDNDDRPRGPIGRAYTRFT
jgi:hypothetical protein